MTFERTLETQRLKLLRLAAGLFVLLGFLSVGPVSRGFSGAVCGFVGSILSRAEAAAQYLVIAQARMMAARSGSDIDWRQVLEIVAPTLTADETAISVVACRRRLKALRGVLMDLPRHARRLIRRIERQMRSAALPDRFSHCPAGRPSALLCLTERRIERPPDKMLNV